MWVSFHISYRQYAKNVSLSVTNASKSTFLLSLDGSRKLLMRILEYLLLSAIAFTRLQPLQSHKAESLYLMHLSVIFLFAIQGFRRC